MKSVDKLQPTLYWRKEWLQWLSAAFSILPIGKIEGTQFRDHFEVERPVKQASYKNQWTERPSWHLWGQGGGNGAPPSMNVSAESKETFGLTKHLDELKPRAHASAHPTQVTLSHRNPRVSIKLCSPHRRFYRGSVPNPDRRDPLVSQVVLHHHHSGSAAQMLIFLSCSYVMKN